MPGAWPVGGTRPSSGFRHDPCHGHRVPAGVPVWDLLKRQLVNAARRVWDIRDRISHTGPPRFDYQRGEPSAHVGAPRGIPGRKATGSLPLVVQLWRRSAADEGSLAIAA
ncbi:hypothetical protein D6D01_09335 [Aureobasidium pullulans]|uniref:Uncharacterized protein n=1 Tax=Aureobasidium pullulans TaxID=5580 RepID=A0A4V4JRK8_AURPU|nr:hypothetical protein D6D01_09335 [Aureobasidium pullulans]